MDLTGLTVNVLWSLIVSVGHLADIATKLIYIPNETGKRETSSDYC